MNQNNLKSRGTYNLLEACDGQATLEFILSFSTLLMFIFFIVYLVFHLSAGYLVHYAVYKSSRAYVTRDIGGDIQSTLQEAQSFATSQFEQFKIEKRFNITGKLEFNSPLSTNIYEYVGAYYQFSLKPFSLGPFGFDQELKLLSESFLGKEPVASDCHCQVLASMGQSCETPEGLEITLYDNGC